MRNAKTYQAPVALLLLCLVATSCQTGQLKPDSPVSPISPTPKDSCLNLRSQSLDAELNCLKKLTTQTPEQQLAQFERGPGLVLKPSHCTTLDCRFQEGFQGSVPQANHALVTYLNSGYVILSGAVTGEGAWKVEELSNLSRASYSLPKQLTHLPEMLLIEKGVNGEKVARYWTSKTCGQSFPSLRGGRIVFSQACLTENNILYQLIHELAHVVYFHLETAETKATELRHWLEIGGWSRSQSIEPDGRAGWLWSQVKPVEAAPTRFNSHSLDSPSEDFSNSLAEYLLHARLFESEYSARFRFFAHELKIVE